MKYSQHPLSSAFPAMTKDEFKELRDSIEVNGVLNPITIYEGMVIDGWHRYKAANEANVDCPETELDEWIDPKDFVLAQNKNRRHITMAQLAIATAEVYKWNPAGRPNNTVLRTGLNKTTAELAKLSGVSETTIEKAKSVLKNASEEVKEAVKSGKIGLSKAKAISKLPKDQQSGAIDKALPKEAPEKPVLTQYYGPEEAELKANEMAQQADLEALNKLLEADDALATAHAEIKRLNLAYAQLDIRFKGLMNEKSEAVRLLQKAQSEIKALRKAQK
jgi:ParB-like chromosome segregation protein Spo0J